MLTGVSPKNTCWSRLMVTTSRCSVTSRTVRVLGTATSIPDCSTGAVIMKITSRTSTTSTSGVMLISASEVRVWPLLLVKATVHLPGRFGSGGIRRPRRAAHRNFFQRVHQFAAKVISCRCKGPDARCELVVSYPRGHSHKESRRRRNQRLGDARRHGPERRRSRRAQPVKGVHNPHHRAEEPDERTDSRDGRQPRHPALQAGYRLAGRGLRRAFQRRQVARRSRATGLPRVGFVHLIEDLRQRARLAFGGKRSHLLQAGRRAETANKPLALPCRLG